MAPHKSIYNSWTKSEAVHGDLHCYVFFLLNLVGASHAWGRSLQAMQFHFYWCFFQDASDFLRYGQGPWERMIYIGEIQGISGSFKVFQVSNRQKHIIISLECRKIPRRHHGQVQLCNIFFISLIIRDYLV